MAREKHNTLDCAVEAISRTPSSRPPSNEDPDPVSDVDVLRQFVDNVPALREAWIRLANANVEHLKHIRKIEKRYTMLACASLLQSLVVLIGIGAAVAFNHDAKREAAATRAVVLDASSALDNFLNAQGATNEAIAKKIQAETTNDPIVGQEAAEAAVAAERETLKAQRDLVAPHERDEVERKLERVERRARKIREAAPLESVPVE